LPLSAVVVERRRIHWNFPLAVGRTSFSASEDIGKDRIIVVAAGVTFYSVLALFPAIAALVALYGLFADPTTITSHLDSIAGLVPAALEVIRDQIMHVASQGRTTLGLTFIAASAATFCHRGLHSIAPPSHRDAIGFGFPFPLGFALIELRGGTLARLLEGTASALSPQHGPVDQGDREYRDHGHVDHEPKPPAGIAVHRLCSCRIAGGQRGNYPSDPRCVGSGAIQISNVAVYFTCASSVPIGRPPAPAARPFFLNARCRPRCISVAQRRAPRRAPETVSCGTRQAEWRILRPNENPVRADAICSKAGSREPSSTKRNTPRAPLWKHLSRARGSSWNVRHGAPRSERTPSPLLRAAILMEHPLRDAVFQREPNNQSHCSFQH
jgi:Virulence factor BrkB